MTTPTRLDNRQARQRTVLDQLTPNTNVRLDTLMNLINDELTPPLRLTASTTPDLILHVGVISIQTSDSGDGTLRNRTIPPIGSASALPTFTSGTITFPAAPGGTVTVSPGTSATLPAMTNGYYMKVGIGLTSQGNLGVAFGTPAATVSTATQPPSVPDAYQIGHVVIQNVGGVIQSIANTNIYQFVGGGGGGSGGGGATLYVAQTTHGFAIGDLIYVNGSGTWSKAQANSPNTLANGIVSLVPDANSFIVQFSGQVTGLSGLSTGFTYFLSPYGAGQAAAGDAPMINTTSWSQPVYIATSTTTAILAPMNEHMKQIQAEYGFRNEDYMALGVGAHVYILSGESVIHPNVIVATGATYTVNGTLIAPGGVYGAGTIDGTGRVIS